MKILINMLLLLLTLSLPHTYAEAEETEALAYAAFYDGRNAEIITPVRDQGKSSLCWAYASVSAAEASILKSGIAPDRTADTFSLSPHQLGYARHNRGADPLGNTTGESTGKDWYYATGDSSYAPALFSQWCGPVSGDLPENCDGWDNILFLLKDSVFLDGSDLKTDSDARLKIKKAILQYGAVSLKLAIRTRLKSLKFVFFFVVGFKIRKYFLTLPPRKIPNLRNFRFEEFFSNCFLSI